MGKRSSLLLNLNLSLGLSYVLLLSALLLVLAMSPAAAQTDPAENYDENTELTVRGIVIEAKRETGGPLVIKLRQKSRIYSVVTAPPWYLTREQIALREGAELEVTGSKFVGKGGALHLMARQIKDFSTGRVTVLRDSHCRPLWHGHRMQRGRNQ